jgi:hypothetical protein
MQGVPSQRAHSRCEVRVLVGLIAVLCPMCLERRSYIVSTEVFLGQPSWEVMRSLQGRK